MNKVFLSLAITLSLTNLTGCVSLTGLQDAKSDFACPLSDGVRCASVSKIHEAQQILPESSASTDAAKLLPVSDPTPEEMADAAESHLNFVVARRRPEVILRIWYAPYVDDAGDLHDQHYLYTTIEPAGWAAESLRFEASGEPRSLTPLAQKTDLPAPYQLDRTQIKECTLKPLSTREPLNAPSTRSTP